MSKKENKDYEEEKYNKALYDFSFECAKKGIDLEATLSSVIELLKKFHEITSNLTNKNYEFLKKGFKNETIRNKKRFSNDKFRYKGYKRV